MWFFCFVLFLVFWLFVLGGFLFCFVWFGFFVFLPTGKFFYLYCIQFLLLIACDPWQSTRRVANTAKPPSLFLVLEPGWQSVGELPSSGVDLTPFCLLSEDGPISSVQRDVLRVSQVEMVFRIHRTDRQWEFPE